MSGEIAGVGVGVLIFAALLPTVITVAAGAATIAATYYIGKGLVHVAGDLASAYADHRKKVKVQNCSKELTETYNMLQAAIDAQASINTQTIKDIGNNFQIKSNPQNISINLDTPQINQKVESFKDSINKMLINSCNDVANMSQTKLDCARKQIQTSLESIERSKNTLASWEAQDAARAANNKALAIEAMRDAKSSLDLLESLASSYGSDSLKRSYNSLKDAYNKAGNRINDGLYQVGFAGAHTIIKNAALVITDHSFGLLETDYYKAILTTKLRGLKEEMQQRRTAPIAIRTPLNEDKTLNDVDLKDYMQGKYDVILNNLDTEIERINDMTDASPQTIMVEIQNFESVTLPEVRKMLDRATLKYLGCKEKVHALETITHFMNAQNYRLQWLQNPGSDLTQKTVVKFARDNTDTSVSVVIDTGDHECDATNMNIGVHSFSEMGGDVPASTQEELRKGLNQALSEEGIGGSLCCDPDFLGQPSQETVYNDKNSVKQIPVRQVI